MEKEKLFETSTVYTAERYLKFGEFHLRSTVKWSPDSALAVRCFSGGIYHGYAGARRIASRLCRPLLYPGGCFCPLPWLIQWMTRRQIETSAQSAEGMTDRCEFYGDYFVETNDEGQTTAFYPRLWRAVETEDCFYLYLDRSTAAVVEKGSFLQGDVSSFRQFLEEKLGDRFRSDVSAGV